MRRLCAGLVVALCSPMVVAHPEGAPWGHAGAGDDPTCAACHQGPAANEPKLQLSGLPGHPQAGETYTLTLEILSPGRVNGFQLEAVGGDDGQNGRFLPADDGSDVEVQDGRARSIAGGPTWQLRWEAGGACTPTVHVAAVAGNDDLSPFEDAVVHDVLPSSCAHDADAHHAGE